MYNILSCSGHFKVVWLKTSICCSLHIGTYMVQVSSFQIPCESFAQNSKFNLKKRVYVTQYIFCSALHIPSRVASLEDQHLVY